MCSQHRPAGERNHLRLPGGDYLWFQSQNHGAGELATEGYPNLPFPGHDQGHGTIHHPR
ncbi:hypothetical protein FOXYSP1_11777 [Fusarium oxysporum f. sp. phaseoli]